MERRASGQYLNLMAYITSNNLIIFIPHTDFNSGFFCYFENHAYVNDYHSIRDVHKACTSQASIIIHGNQLSISCTFRDTYYCQVLILSSVRFNRSFRYFIFLQNGHQGYFGK